VGLSWQQGPLSTGAIGRFLVPEPLPKRLLYVEPLRRRMRVRFGGAWIVDSDRALLLFEPGRYPVAYFPETDVSANALQRAEQTTRHDDLGPTAWYTVRGGERSAPRGAWQHVDLPDCARDLHGRVAFAWRAMDAFYEEDERILGHAADPYKGLCSYYDIGEAHRAAWSYREAYSEVCRISDLVSFEPDIVSVQLDGAVLRLESGQTVIPHGPDRDLTADEARRRS